MIQDTITSLTEQSDFDGACLESFKTFVGYKYPILSPKRTSLERKRAGIDDHASALSKIENRWNPGILESMRESSKQNSPSRSRSRSPCRTLRSPTKLFNQDDSIFRVNTPFDFTNDRPDWNQGQGGCIRHKR